MKKHKEINLGLVKVNSIDIGSQFSIGFTHKQTVFTSMKNSHLFRQAGDRSVLFDSEINIDDRDLSDNFSGNFDKS
ncbi:hypothetical protein ABEO75_12615 [Paenibacillus macerans]|uniref:hypothetical protein n=1 Tax=Paenibacillus macerans TaxID=44252 RepID=UPI002E1CE8C6|nr:hypothetical protein [Paenibacillus macerans]